jgi:nucleoside-diphosphate-sugar epimerase
MPAVKSGVVAVTGASGFIGSHVVKALLERGFTVRAVVRDAADATKTAFLRDIATAISAQAASKLSFWSGDLLVADSYDAAFQGADAVVHTAAVVDLSVSSDPINKIVKPSVDGSQNVISAVKKSGTVKRIVHTSSVAAIMRVDEPVDFAFTEADFNTYSSVDNGDAYGYAKRVAEQVIWDGVKGQAAFDAVSINPSVVLGEVFTKAHTKATPVICRQALYNATTVSFFANFVDVRDVAAAHAEALVRQEASGQRFILNSDAPPMMLHEIGGVVARLFPQFQISLAPAIGAWTWWAISLVSYVPVLGGWVLKPAQRMSVEKRFFFKNDASKKVLNIKYHTLDEMCTETVNSLVNKGFVKPKAKL